MSLEFIKAYGGARITNYEPQPVLLSSNQESEEKDEAYADLDYEVSSTQWQCIEPALLINWRPADWGECPIRFIDGKDVGETVAVLRAPGGYSVPVRLAQVGATAIRTENDVCRREFAI